MHTTVSGSGHERPSLDRLSQNLFRLEDTCNAYLLVDGASGLLIDAGSGAVADVLGAAGVTSLEWILHTHFHRDQCWGTPRLVDELGARVAVPEHERYLFESAGEHWQTKRVFDNYNDRNTFFAPGEDIPVHAVLEDYERFSWRGYDFLVLPAKGHTAGSSALIAEIDGRTVAFTGDLMMAGGLVYQLHALEYGYGEMAGVAFTLQSLQALRRRDVDVALPSHGAPVTAVSRDIDRLEERLMDIVRLGAELQVAGLKPPGPPLETDFLPEPRLVRLSEHLLWGGPWTCACFYVVLSGTGEALLVDYGHAFGGHMHVLQDAEPWESMRFVEHHLDELRERYGVTSIEVVVATHAHDDHVCGIPYLQRHHGAACWALDEVANVLEDPAAWASTPCTLPKPIQVQHKMADGERRVWRGLELTFHHAPGQSEFHSVISAEIDGATVAFTGDNYFPYDVEIAGVVQRRATQTTVLRNSFQLGMHRRCAAVMRAIAPDLVCPGHGHVLRCDKRALAEYADSIVRKEEAFRAAVGAPADQYLDLFWTRLLPYTGTATPGATVRYALLVRNNLERRATFAARIVPPSGWSAAHEASALQLDAGERGEIDLAVEVPSDATAGRKLVTAEVLIDGRSQGPLAEALVTVGQRSRR